MPSGPADLVSSWLRHPVHTHLRISPELRTVAHGWQPADDFFAIERHPECHGTLAPVSRKFSERLLRWRSLVGEFRRAACRPAPVKPRYAPDEYRRLMVAAWDADAGLLLARGLVYRLRQVVQSDQREDGMLRVLG